MTGCERVCSNSRGSRYSHLVRALYFVFKFMCVCTGGARERCAGEMRRSGGVRRSGAEKVTLLGSSSPGEAAW